MFVNLFESINTLVFFLYKIVLDAIDLYCLTALRAILNQFPVESIFGGIFPLLINVQCFCVACHFPVSTSCPVHKNIIQEWQGIIISLVSVCLMVKDQSICVPWFYPCVGTLFLALLPIRVLFSYEWFAFGTGFVCSPELYDSLKMKFGRKYSLEHL